MANKFKFIMVTPDGKKFEDDAVILNVVTTAGALGILANHLPLVAIIEISHLNYKNESGSFDFAIGGGILNVKKDEVLVLAESFEAKHEIDKERALRAKERAEKFLQMNDENIDIKRAELALKRALSRLSI